MQIFVIILEAIDMLLKTIPVGTDLWVQIHAERQKWAAYQAAASDEKNEMWKAAREEAKSYYERLMQPL